MYTQLYHSEIIQHAQSSPYCGALKSHTHRGSAHNRLCGDSVEITVLIEHEQVIEAGFESTGCILCCASSSMMCEWIKERSLKEIQQISKQIRRDHLGADVEIFSAFNELKSYPTRARCVTLPWEIWFTLNPLEST